MANGLESYPVINIPFFHLYTTHALPVLMIDYTLLCKTDIYEGFETFTGYTLKTPAPAAPTT